MNQTIVYVPPIAMCLYDAVFAQTHQVLGYTRLAQVQHRFEMTNAGFLFRDHVKDL
jgi:hypothetical protein